MVYMYDNGVEENIKEFLDTVQEQEISNKPCWPISLVNV
jgi:hypothetical protein